MTISVERLRLVCGTFALVAIVGWSGVARADGDAGRRAYVEALSRRAKTEMTRAAAKASEASHKAAETRTLAHHKGSPVLSKVSSTAPTSMGAAALSPLTATGYGLGRDLFINYFYPGALDRAPVESELEYWSGLLAKGVKPEIIASAIWNSQERRLLVNEGLAPKYTLKEVYIWSIGAANANK
jgi:hypothetical protein